MEKITWNWKALRTLLLLGVAAYMLIHILSTGVSWGRRVRFIFRNDHLGSPRYYYEEDIFSVTTAMDDARLIRTVRKLLTPPSTSPYNFSKNIRPGEDASAGQLMVVIDILASFGEDAFFLDCGAMDGETVSNTLFLEKTLNWRGLMIEANPVEYANLISKNRKAWTANFCLSSTNYPKILPFYQSPPGYGMSSLILFRKDVQTTPPIQVPCFPLYTVLLAVNRTVVDFFSFDVEGSEMNILRTVPFDKVIFKVLVIENILIKEGKQGLRKFMEDNGYIFFGEIIHSNAQDSVFIHHSVKLTTRQQKRIGRINRV